MGKININDFVIDKVFKRLDKERKESSPKPRKTVRINVDSEPDVVQTSTCEQTLDARELGRELNGVKYLDGPLNIQITV